MKALITIFIIGLLAIFGVMEQDRQKRIERNAELTAENATLAASIERLESENAKLAKAPETVATPEPAKVASVARPEPRVEQVTEYRPAYVAPEPRHIEPERVDNSARIREIANQVIQLDAKIAEARRNLSKKETEWRIESQNRGIRESESAKTNLRNQVEQYIAGLRSQRDALNAEAREL